MSFRHSLTWINVAEGRIRSNRFHVGDANREEIRDSHAVPLARYG